MNKAQISVILPFYNVSKYLGESIKSIINQSFKDFELILINDGSTDNSLQIAESFANRDKRITILNQKNKGMAGALNNGINVANTDIIARMDGDDICHCNRLKEQFHLIKQMPSNSIVSSLVRPFSDAPIPEGSIRYFKWLNSKHSHIQILEGLFKESPLIHPSVMFTKEAFYSAGEYKEYSGPEDYDLWLRMVENNTTFAKVNQVCLQYRIHYNNLSRKDMTHYSLDAFRKRQYSHLIRMINSNFLSPSNEYVICGAGKEGKRIFNALTKTGITIKSFIDVDPKKVGNNYKGTTILSASHIQKKNNTIYLCTTGSWKSEEILEDLFKSKSMLPIIDFLIL